MKRLTVLNLVGAGLILCGTLTVEAQEDDTEQAVIDSLKRLDFAQLPEVEVSLDAAFDVFDGLIQAKKTTVATGIKQYTNRAPSVTTVITAQDIEAMGARDLDEVLETVPGLHVARDNNGYRPIYTIRGMYSINNPEVLMLINGIPITGLFAGDRGFAWGGMSINMISRIEVIRGPGSAVYGADAFSGVINIMTKTKDDIKGTEIGTRAGSFNTYEGWALYGDTLKGVDVAASLEYRTTDGQKSTVSADAQTQFDKLFGTHASLAPGPVNTGGDSIEARIDAKKGYWQARAGYQGRRNLGTGAGVAQALDPQGYLTADRTNADLTYHNPDLATHWDVTAQLSYLDMAYQILDDKLFPSGAFGGTYPNGFIGNPGTSERHTRLDTFAFYSGFQKHLIRLGVGYHYGDQYDVVEFKNFGINPATGLPLPPGASVIDVSNTSYAYNQQKKRKNWSLSLQDTWTLANEWEFTAGVRHDDYSDFGGTTNPRLALVWQPHRSFTSKLMYGRAFRAPSFIEMYSTNNPNQLGSRDVTPEIINTWELAFDYRAMENLHLAANLFHYKATDKIQLVAVPGASSLVFENIGVQEGQGLELEARWKMSKRSSLLANYSYVKATDQKNSRDIGNYPHHSAYIRTDWLLIPNWYLDSYSRSKKTILVG